METAQTKVIAVINGLRLVKTQSGYFMDQHGRCFKDSGGKLGKYVCCGYATH